MDGWSEADARTWLAMDLLAPVHELWAALEAAPAAQVSANGLLGEHRPELTEAALAGDLDLERALVVGAALDVVGGFADAELVAAVECALVDEACRLLLMPLVNAAADLLLELGREAASVEEPVEPVDTAGPVDPADVVDRADAGEAGGVGTGAVVQPGPSEGDARAGGCTARACTCDAARSDGAGGADGCAVIGTTAGVLGRRSPWRVSGRRVSGRRVSGRGGSDRQRRGGLTAGVRASGLVAAPRPVVRPLRRAVPPEDREERSRGPPRAAPLLPTVSAGLTMVAPASGRSGSSRMAGAPGPGR